MKHFQHYIITLLFLYSTALFLNASEYYHSAYNSPIIEIYGGLHQPNSENPSRLSCREQYLNGIIQHNKTPQIPSHIKSIAKSNHQDIVIYRSTAWVIENLSSLVKSHRNKILNQFMDNDPEIHASSLRKYSLSSLGKQYIACNNIDINALESCNGNILQQIIHQEFVMLTDATAHIWSKKSCTNEIKELTGTIGDFIDAGVSFNKAGEAKKALTLADAGWALFDCILAAGEGIIDGVTSVVHDITHPIQTVQNLANAAISCGYYLGVALQEIDSATAALISGNFDTAHNKYIIWCENFKKITQILDVYSQELTAHDTIKTITSSLIQCYAITRVINGFSSLFNNAHKSAINIAKKISEGVQENTLLISAEGIPLRIAQETLKQIKKVPCAQDKLLQALAHFDHQIIRVGNVTCLLDKKGLKHILERHHPKYWNGTIEPFQSFLGKNMTIVEIVDIIKKVIKQNKKIIIKQGIVNGQIDGVVNNVKYRVGFKKGRIGQFYIPIIK
jgi:hypothetical protein